MRQLPSQSETLIKYLKNHHQQQIDKLIVKNQLEVDIVEDIRSFVKQKCNLDKNYAEGLLKLSTSYQNRKLPNIPSLDHQSVSENNSNEPESRGRRISLSGDCNGNGKQIIIFYLF